MNKTTASELDAYARQVRERIAKIRAATDEHAAQLQTDLSQYITRQTQTLMAKGVPITKIQDAVRAATDILPQTHTPTPDDDTGTHANATVHNEGDINEILCFLPLDDSIIAAFTNGKLPEPALLKLLRDSPETETFELLEGIDHVLTDYGKTNAYDDATGGGNIVPGPDGEALIPDPIVIIKSDGTHVTVRKIAIHKPAADVREIAATLKPLDGTAFLKKFDINKLHQAGYLDGYDSDSIKAIKEESEQIAETLREEYTRLRDIYTRAAKSGKGVLIFPKYQNANKGERKSMFKFLKELAGSFKEGVDEAKAELAAEKEQKKQHLADLQKRIATIPEPEKFALAIAAPFRAVHLSEWSPILESDESDGNVTWPYALYSFGDKDSLTDEKRKEMPELIERDFDIIDKPSAIRAIASILQASSLSDKLKEHADADALEAGAKINDLLQSTSLNHEAQAEVIKMLRAHKAFGACMASYAISCSADCGYMEKAQALELLADIANFVKKEYTSWKDFGEEFLCGERESELNNALGRRLLAKYTGYLHMKPGSPWRTISWPKNS